MPHSLRLEVLAKHHMRKEFYCGNESLDQYLRAQAGQDMRRKANAVFVLVPEENTAHILGYFTLCACGLAPGEIPEDVRGYLPRYPQVSAILLGRLAIQKSMQGRGLGGILLAHALRRVWESVESIGSSMVVVDVLDEKAASFYRAHGFLQLHDSMRLILPMRTIGQLIRKPDQDD